MEKTQHLIIEGRLSPSPSVDPPLVLDIANRVLITAFVN